MGQPPKLLDQLRNVIRTKHYSICRSVFTWIGLGIHPFSAPQHGVPEHVDDVYLVLLRPDAGFNFVFRFRRQIDVGYRYLLLKAGVIKHFDARSQGIGWVAA